MSCAKDTQKWQPLALEKLNSIRKNFSDLFPAAEYGDLAKRISEYWTETLNTVWKNKPAHIRKKDLSHRPDDPLSRIHQKTVVIAYADSVFQENTPTLKTLDEFLSRYFPAVGGLHILPACMVAENRFNDGYFSQIVRNKIHPGFGTNQQFAGMAEKYFSMADFVLNHVDIENPEFQSFLNGNDASGDCFFIFTENEYQKRLANGDFETIFRPRPFPLFTIFRRRPTDKRFAKMDMAGRKAAMRALLAPDGLPEPVVGLLSIFDKVKNDQMLLEADYAFVAEFIDYLKQTAKPSPDAIFTLSNTQETCHPPYIFNRSIQTKTCLLRALGHDTDAAQKIAAIFELHDEAVFGEQVRALTTFSHVQVDLNTGTFRGLKMLADDFAWYLSLDLNMLRLDAANFAFKRWKTSCFGLPEVKRLMKILFLSMDCVSPRITANLEVNDKLSAVLSQMADRDAPPPMMYDFHLPALLPVIFNAQNTDIAARIFDMIRKYDIPKQSIRFSVAETHDGKSVRGSLDLLTPAERQNLAKIIEKNGGKIKSKGVPPRQYLRSEFRQICLCASLDETSAAKCLFSESPAPSLPLQLKEELLDESDIAKALNIDRSALDTNDALMLFCNTVIHGREPYELCTSTRDALIKLHHPALEAQRFLAFYTMGFALMGRNVKSIYFNDLMGLTNDHERLARTGELRDIKRTKSGYDRLEEQLNDPDTVFSKIAKGINTLIAIVDADPAMHFRGNEAKMIPTGNPAVACIHNQWDNHHSIILVSTSQKHEAVSIDLSGIKQAMPAALIDQFSQKSVDLKDDQLKLDLEPYHRSWLKKNRIIH